MLIVDFPTPPFLFIKDIIVMLWSFSLITYRLVFILLYFIILSSQTVFVRLIISQFSQLFVFY